jgi:hypothetical protein
MPGKGFTNQYRTLGTFSAWTVSALIVLYVIALSLGLLSLPSPQDPIADPYFSIMEILILLMAPLLVTLMASVHAYASPEDKSYSLSALIFMILLAGITSAVHFVVLTVSRQIEAAGFSGAALLFSFQWPSVIYTLDILAWDWFFSLSVLFGAAVFKTGRLERTVRTVMIISGVLSLAGLIGVPLANMNVRNIGIVGYTVVALVAFIMMGVVFRRSGGAREMS